MPLSRPPRTAVIVSLALLASGLVAPPAGAAPEASGGRVRVVIELAGPTAAAVAGPAQTRGARAGRARAVTTYDAAVAQVGRRQDEVLSRVSAAGVELSGEEPLTGLLNGVVATVDERDLAALRRVSGVARVSLDQAAYALGEANIPATGAPQVWERSDASGTALRGRGVTVAVIDTGVDYSLPDLGEGFGDGFRVVAGHDFVNDDADPMDDHGHGTHVAGVVAGDGTQTIAGMAPEASLTAWKVLDDTGAGTLVDILLGLEAATDPLGVRPADVVNLSLGTAGDGTDPVGRAASAAAQQGVVVVAAAGNSGPGEQTIGSPASAPGVLAVGAQVTGVRLPTLRLRGAESRDLPVTRFPLSANPPEEGLSARLVDVDEGDEAGFDAAGDVTGAIVVMRSHPVGSLGEVAGAHLAQAELAEARGAAGVLLYGTGPTDPGGGPSGGIGGRAGAGIGALAEGGWDLRRESLVMMSMQGADYRAFREEVAAGGLTATVGSTDATDLLADFSSRGPTDAMALKPEIVAPGFEVLSSFPASLGIEGNQYRMSGTSMASPHVAGAAALLAQARPTATAAQLRARLVGSARPLASADAGSSPSGQGAGALDVAAAVDQQVTASPDAVSLGLADMGGAGRRTAAVVLRNDGPVPVTVALALRPSAASTGTATLSTRSLSIPAGREASVDLTAEPLLGARDGETSGQLVGTVSDGTTLRVPYAQYVRPLVVQATPDPAVGSSEIFVHSGSSLATEGVVTLTAQAPSGRRTTVGLRAEPTGGAGWYRASLPLDETGEHLLTARATVAGRTITGTTRIRSLPAARPGAWEQVGVLGDATRVAVSPGAPGTALAVGTVSPYPFVTTDRGATWRRSPSMPVAGGWGIPVADPRSPGAFYLALNGYFGRAPLDPSYRGRVLHTADAGRTWTVLPFPDVAIEALVARGDAVAAVVPDGLVLSTDGGRSWREVRHPWRGSALAAAFAGDDLVVSDGTGLWRVADAVSGGALPVAAETPADLTHIFGVDADDDAAVAALRGGRVLRSTDGGASWTEVATDGPEAVTDISIAGGTLFLGGVEALFTSEDYGTTLVEQDKPKRGPVITDVDRWPGSAPDSALVTMENAGVYESADGGSWTEIGVSGTTVSDLDVGADDTGAEVLLAVDREGLHARRTSELDVADPDWGATGNEGWIGREYTAIAQSPLGERDLWAVGGTANGEGKVLTGPAGSTSLGTVGPRRPYTASALAVSPTSAGTVVVGYTSVQESGLMVSRDGFETWRSHVSGRRTAQVLFDPVVADRLWLATNEGLFRSDDLGATSTRLTTAPAESVLVDPVDPRRVVVGELGGISVSADGGRTFRPAQLPTANAAVSSLVALNVPAGSLTGTRLLVAGARQWERHGLSVNGAGPFVSVDGGRTWTPADAGLSAMSVRSLAVSGDGDWVYAGTDNGGVHRTPAAALVPDLPPTTPVPPTPGPPAAVATTTTVRAPDRVRLGERPAVRVLVRTRTGAPARGTVVVVVRRGGKQVARRVVTVRSGRAAYRLAKLRSSGSYRVVVTYRPADGFAASTGRVVIRVRR